MTVKRREEQQWLTDMENDAVKLGAHDFAIKHKIYNLPVWESMQDGPKTLAMLKTAIITLGQLRKFLVDCLSGLEPDEVINSETGQWLNYTIQKIDLLLETFPHPHENI